MKCRLLTLAAAATLLLPWRGDGPQSPRGAQVIPQPLEYGSQLRADPGPPDPTFPGRDRHCWPSASSGLRGWGASGWITSIAKASRSELAGVPGGRVVNVSGFDDGLDWEGRGRHAKRRRLPNANNRVHVAAWRRTSERTPDEA